MQSQDRNPLVSIVIPAYNHENYIGKCIESIIEQTYNKIELIIVNDGSMDRTRESIISYEKKCKERFVDFVFIDKENEGVCKTLNLGIKNCRGDYISVVASDDLYLPNKIEMQIKLFIKRPDLKFIWTNGYIFDSDKHYKKLIYKNEPIYANKNVEATFYNLFLHGNFIVNPSCMYSKDIFEQVGFFDENLKFEDWDFYMRIAEKYKIGYIHRPLVLYRLHAGNTIKRTKYMYEGDMQIIEKAIKCYKLSDEKLISTAYSNLFCRNAERNFNVDKEQYNEFIKKSFKENKFNIKLYKLIIKNVIKKIIGRKQ